MSYLNDVETQLYAMPREERDEILAYYDEYFTDAHLTDEQAKQKFGTPKHFARRLVADYYMNTENTTELKPKNQIKMIWMVILAILASPVILPVAILIIAILIAIAAVVGSVIVTILAVLFTILIIAIVSIVSGVAIIFSSVTGGIFSIGIGLSAIGFLILVGPLFIAGMRVVFNGFASLIKWIGRQFIKKGENYEA